MYRYSNIEKDRSKLTHLHILAYEGTCTGTDMSDVRDVKSVCE